MACHLGSWLKISSPQQPRKSQGHEVHLLHAVVGDRGCDAVALFEEAVDGCLDVVGITAAPELLDGEVVGLAHQEVQGDGDLVVGLHSLVAGTSQQGGHVEAGALGGDVVSTEEDRLQPHHGAEIALGLLVAGVVPTGLEEAVAEQSLGGVEQGDVVVERLDAGQLSGIDFVEALGHGHLGVVEQMEGDGEEGGGTGSIVACVGRGRDERLVLVHGLVVERGAERLQGRDELEGLQVFQHIAEVHVEGLEEEVGGIF